MSKVEWTDATWNVVTGCNPVSEGCKHCYAKVMHKRLQAMKSPKYKDDFNVVKFHLETLDIPYHWKKPRMVFVNSMSDTFHEDIMELEYSASPNITKPLTKIFDIIARCPQHIFQILTKRPENASYYITGRKPSPLFPNCRPADRYLWSKAHKMPPNVWLGTTVESNQTRHRIDTLRDTYDVVKFISCEPLLSRLPNMDLTGIDWVIVGAESGHRRREMKVDWALNIAEQCKRAGVPFFMKQMFDGKRKLKFEEFPEELRIREYPKTK